MAGGPDSCAKLQEKLLGCALVDVSRARSIAESDRQRAKLQGPLQATGAFKTVIPLAAKIGQSIETTKSVTSIKQKYGEFADRFESLTEEIMTRVVDMKGSVLATPKASVK